jgi:GT2 family glycosyltransferase
LDPVFSKPSLAADGGLEHLLLSRVLIILVNWNGLRDTVECLESLQQLDYPDFRVVVCDNGSSDDSLAQIRSWADSRAVLWTEYQRSQAEAGGLPGDDPQLTLIRIEENLGFAGGNNVGLRYGMAQGDVRYYWLLNNDTVVEPAALTQMVKRIQADQMVGICGSTIRLYHNHDKIQALGGGHYYHWLGLPWHYGRFIRWGRGINQEQAEARMNYVEGASMLVSKQFVEQVGLMCEDYFLYFEEADWVLRAKGRFCLGYAPHSIVYHKIGASIGTSSNPIRKSVVCDYYNIRNRIRFTLRHYPVALPTVYLVLALETLIRILLGRWKRASMVIALMLRAGADLEKKP